MGELIAYAVFGGYFALIGLSFFLVGRSIVDRIPEWKRLAEGRAFLFLRVAVAALGTTWYFMIEYMKWSYKNFATGHFEPTIGQWLQGTALFEEAWSIVSTGPANWWWSSFICTWTVLFTAVVWIEGPRRRIKHSWAYMLLGQLVAMSVATSLFFVAVSLYPRGRQLKPGRYAPLLLSLTIAMVTIALSPHTVGTSKFMPNLLVMHVSLVLPLLAPPETEAIKVEDRSGRRTSISWLYPIYLTIAALIHLQNTYRLKALDSNSPTLGVLLTQIVLHPAQASISFDVIWVFISLALWFLSSGSLVVIFLKLTGLVGVVAAGLVLQVGINWTLVGSVLPIVTLGALGFTLLGVSRMRNRNVDRRRVLMESMGIVETGVVPGTANAPPKMAKPRTLVGFWHPYCNAGGGGERVLWTALSHLQKNEPEVISLVYSGDYPKASKEEILAKIKERFAIELSPKTLHFIPLPSRYLVDDTYWKRFTLLGQSLGSLVLAYEGLCGKDGLWGDIFIDTMGYAFTYPLIRLLTGSEIAIGAYIHYPTVSTDMVKRVKERSFGIENAGASGSWIRTKIKLIYYHLFTTLYATSLLFSEYNMTNSSWTQAHILSLINKGRKSLLASLLLVDEASVERDLKSGKGSKAKCEIVYPPCDTGVLVGLKLDQRTNELVSLAQFRPEKEHAKQIHALAVLFEKYPQHRAAKVKLTLMGGARHPADEARVEDLRQLARKLGVQDHVEFLVNAPFPEITARLARASIGLNTMQDEHFGINVVEFMAAGLIPIVHASAGPMMDIVVPYKGQKTGFHAKTAEEFAEAIHQALSLSNKQAGEMRRAARAGAVEKFSEKEFWRHFQLGWRELNRIAIRRRLLDNEH